MEFKKKLIFFDTNFLVKAKPHTEMTVSGSALGLTWLDEVPQENFVSPFSFRGRQPK